MKKFLIATVVLLGSISLANAEQFRIGVSLMGAVFEADGATETFSGNHAGNRSSTKVTKNTSDDKDSAEGAFALGSIFAEMQANDQISFGINYVPHSSDSEETENVQNFGDLPEDDGNDNASTNSRVDSPNNGYFKYTDLPIIVRIIITIVVFGILFLIEDIRKQPRSNHN